MFKEAKKIISLFEQSVAKLVLHCVSTLPLPLGINKTIGVMKGVKSTFIVDHKLYELPVYGIFSTFTKGYLETVIDILLDKGLLEIIMVSKYDNLPILSLTPKGQDFLNNQVIVETPFAEELRNKEIILLSNEEQELFHEMRKLRRKIAIENEIPPYTIIHDSVLREISRLKPRAADKLLSIRGIGENFVRKYGDDFLKLIHQYSN